MSVLFLIRLENISIHALRGEGDVRLSPPTKRSLRFQSTPSVGRATKSTATISSNNSAFQSTPSVGRATKMAVMLDCLYKISIHALRGEGDHKIQCGYSSNMHFNPRPPWGGRPEGKLEGLKNKAFQSTPSVGRATIKVGQNTGAFSFQSTPSVGRATAMTCSPPLPRGISIHALRGEGDRG